MESLDISFEDPKDNILFDEVLLYLAENQEVGEILRFWEPPKPFIVLGKTSNIREDLIVDNVIKDRIPVFRRSSGGGTVFQDQGCLNYALILDRTKHAALNNINSSYEYILAHVIKALDMLGINTVFMPVCDVALAGSLKKISGNAQKRGKKYILHHGTFLCRLSSENMERYLAFPFRVPDYRRCRSHADFVGTLDADARDVKEVMKKAFAVSAEQSVLNTGQTIVLEEFRRSRNILCEISGKG